MSEKVGKIFWTQFIPLMIAISLMPLFIWLFDHTPPVLYYQTEAISSEVRQGEELRITITGVRERPCYNTVIEQTITDSAGVIHSLKERTTVIPQDQIGVAIKREVEVPVTDGMEPGEAVYSPVAIYRCNPVWRVWPLRMPEPSVRFTILPADRSVPEELRIPSWQQQGITPREYGILFEDDG
jgi:hypothetical protein